ncbi:MAG: ABC transporter ATP-binding protein [Cetobacterium sp.]|uniref:ABC transporter ATP-binding protein n=1 Tax=Cetobacterium sp. TaxID=2071632 RepID=UPI003EE5993A
MLDIIEIFNVNKSYVKTSNIFGNKKEKTEALKDISFSIKKGEILGILGPNGAGKSTIIKIMSTLLKEDSGRVKFFLNKESKENIIRKKINLISGSERGLYWRLTGKENLEYFAELYGITGRYKYEKIDQLLDLVELKGRENEKVEKYSKGMKQRLQIARGLINSPEILFLDEPTLGLDILGAKKLRKLIKNLSLNGNTIIFTTHYMNEAEEICDRILFMNHGKIVKIGEINELKSEIINKKNVKIEFKRNDIEQLMTEILQTKNIENLKILENKVEFSCDENIFKIENFLIDILKIGEIDTIKIANPSLEELYINLIEEDRHL